MPPPTHQRRQRIALGAREKLVARQLLDTVPALAYDWQSDAGQAFLAYVHQLAGRGTPVSWVAAEVGLDAQRLYVTLTRYRRGLVA